jgi:hypothetical protein
MKSLTFHLILTEKKKERKRKKKSSRKIRFSLNRLTCPKEEMTHPNEHQPKLVSGLDLFGDFSLHQSFLTASQNPVCIDFDGEPSKVGIDLRILELINSQRIGGRYPILPYRENPFSRTYKGSRNKIDNQEFSKEEIEEMIKYEKEQDQLFDRGLLNRFGEPLLSEKST